MSSTISKLDQINIISPFSLIKIYIGKEMKEIKVLHKYKHLG